MNNYDLPLTRKCSGPCNGFGSVILIKLNPDELERWNKNYNMKFKNGKNMCPICKGKGYLDLENLELELV